MDVPVSADVFLFGAYRFDRRAGVLFRRDEDGAFVLADIGSRAIAVLDILVARHGDLVSKEEIMQAVWPGTVVEENNLTVQISTLRRVLDQGRSEGSCIQTVPRRGYRFTVPVTRVAGEMQWDDGASAERPYDVAPERASRARPPRRDRVVIGLVAGVMLLAAVVGALWGLGPARLSPRAGKAADDAAAMTPAAAAIAPPLVALRLSIVVLPFANLGRDPDQRYFAEGITEDLTTDLSRVPHMFVISRDTAFTYRDKPVNVKRIGRELGVRYVLEGSVQRSGGKVRVNAQLIDAETDTHLWAERFDRDIGDLFALQNDITGRIANTLGGALMVAEAVRPTRNLDALDYIFRGRGALYEAASPDGFAEAIKFFEHALALDPRSVEAELWLAWALLARAGSEATSSPARDVARAEELIGQGLAASSDNPTAHFVKGLMLRMQGRPDEAIFEFDAVLADNPNAAMSTYLLGWCKMMTGSINEAIPLTERAIRLSPRNPNIAWFYVRMGLLNLFQSRTAEAIQWFERARTSNPRLAAPHAMLGAVYALKGEAERAAAELAEARRLSPDNRYSSLAGVKAAGLPGSRNYWGVPKVRALFEATYFAGLRKAGMPEE